MAVHLGPAWRREVVCLLGAVLAATALSGCSSGDEDGAASGASQDSSSSPASPTVKKPLSFQDFFVFSGSPWY